MLLETNTQNTTQATYTNEPEQYGSLVSQYRNSTTSWYHFDALGSTNNLTNTSETITDSYIYDAWGNNLSSSGTTVNPFQYVGQYGYYHDEETGSNYIRARVYSPTIGRWASADPLGFVDGLNMYLAYFVPSDIDPSGLWKKRGRVYESDQCHESLEDLAELVTGDREDWVCIWPIGNSFDWQKYPTATIGALASVSNLKAKPRKFIKMRQRYKLGDGFMEGVNAFWGRREYVWKSGTIAGKYLAPVQ